MAANNQCGEIQSNDINQSKSKQEKIHGKLGLIRHLTSHFILHIKLRVGFQKVKIKFQ